MLRALLFFTLLAWLSAPLCLASERADTPMADSTEQMVVPSEQAPKKKRGRNFLGRLLRSFSEVDTNYVEPCHYNYTVMLQNTNTMQYYQLRGKKGDDTHQSLNFESEPSFKLGPYFGWQWMFWGYTFNMREPQHSTSKYPEFNVSLYSAALGIDVIYQKNKGNYKLNRYHGFGSVDNPESFKGKTFDGFRTSIFTVNTYYIFSHKKFSYPAVFSQTTQQKRSHGSLKVGFQFSHQDIRFDYWRLPEDLLFDAVHHERLAENLKFSHIDYYDYSFSAGYAYNWVFLPNCVLCLSLSPAIGYKHTKGEERHKKMKYYMNNINFDVVGRSGLVWNNGHYFAGGTFVMHGYTYHKEHFSMANTMGSMNLYAGFYFGLKKKYKRLRHAAKRKP